MNDVKVDFKNGLVPCVVQDSTTKTVLMLGYMNDEAFAKTCAEGRVTFFSRSKNRLWTKGETSGNFLDVIKITSDCDNDTLLIQVKPHGPVCHKGADTCFSEINDTWSLKKLESIISERKINPSASSYTSKLFADGINMVAQKVGEEAVELIIESKDNNPDKFLNEAADLLYHYLVLLAAKESNLDQVVNVLRNRFNKMK
jgi:phosphoribosyl-AMP cyclohydrolase / phosphoribosyl-ATP pyrophosphohydrolase